MNTEPESSKRVRVMRNIYRADDLMMLEVFYRWYSEEITIVIDGIHNGELLGKVFVLALLELLAEQIVMM